MAKDPLKTQPLEVVPNVRDVAEHDIADALSTVETSVTDARYLKLRAGLTTNQGPPGKILVRKPESPIWFPLYDMEWRVAQLMDGTRSISELASAMARLGIGASPDAVRSFARELKGYGFLEETSIQSLVSTNNKADPKFETTSEEVNQLLATAMALQARGDLDEACNYLLAVLEIEPANHSVRDLLRRLQQEASERSLKPNTLLTAAQNERENENGFSDDSGSFRENTGSFQRVGHLTDMTRDVTYEVMKDHAVASGKTGWIVALVGVMLLLVLGLVVFVAIVFLKNQKLFLPEIPMLGTTTSVTTPNDLKRSQNGLTFSVKLVAATSIPITITEEGVLYKVLVKPGDRIKQDQIVAEIVPAKAWKKMAKLKTNFERLKKKGRRDRVYRFYTKEAQEKLEKAQQTINISRVVSHDVGAVKQIKKSEGDLVQAKDVLLELENSLLLRATIDARSLPDKVKQYQCQATISSNQARVSCEIQGPELDELGQSVVNILISNRSDSIKVGQWAEIKLTEM